jgi:hypothetical protein
MDFPFEIAGGSITGQAHLAAGRNNQDAFCWAVNGAGLVAVVCDGCGTAPHSDVGAKLGAQLVVQAAARLLTSDLDPSEILEQVRRDVLERLRGLAAEMSVETSTSAPGGVATFARTVLEYFLFTIVGVVITPRHATTFSLGDGLVVFNGDCRLLGPFPNNEPPYLGYALLSRSSSERSSFEVHRPVPVDEVRSLLLGTDGAVDLEASADRAVHGREETVGSLSQFWTDDRFFRNADMVRRRLTIVSRRPRGSLLPDDTTLVIVRRKPREA